MKDKITMEDIKAAVKSEQYHVFPGSKTTVCLLTLQNGFEIVGTSACVKPENFNKEEGEKWAADDARHKAWPYLGFCLQEDRYRAEQVKEG